MTQYSLEDRALLRRLYGEAAKRVCGSIAWKYSGAEGGAGPEFLTETQRTVIEDRRAHGWPWASLYVTVTGHWLGYEAKSRPLYVSCLSHSEFESRNDSVRVWDMGTTHAVSASEIRREINASITRALKVDLRATADLYASLIAGRPTIWSGDCDDCGTDLRAYALGPPHVTCAVDLATGERSCPQCGKKLKIR